MTDDFGAPSARAAAETPPSSAMRTEARTMTHDANGDIRRLLGRKPTTALGDAFGVAPH